MECCLRLRNSYDNSYPEEKHSKASKVISVQPELSVELWSIHFLHGQYMGKEWRKNNNKKKKISPFCYEATIPLGLMPLHRHREEMGPWTFYILSLPPPIFCFLSHTRLSNSGPYPPPFIYCSLQCYKQRPQSVFQPSGHSYFSTRCPYAMHSLTFHAIAHLRHLFSHDFGSHCLAFLPEELN